jgi:hypothetical protein
MIDDDRADQAVEHRIAEVGRFRYGTFVHFRPQRLEPLTLGDAPTGVSRRLCILAADIDMDSADFQRAGAVDRQNAALGAFHLREEGPGQGDPCEDKQNGQRFRPARQHRWAFGDNGVEIQARCG